MDEITHILAMDWDALRRDLPGVADFFVAASMGPDHGHPGPGRHLDALGEQDWQDRGQDKDQFLAGLAEYLRTLADMAGGTGLPQVREVTIYGGRDKSGNPEVHEIYLRPGEITGIVGPTGSGKSRLLADIEWMARGDTPTCRRILVNGIEPDPELRFNLEHKLVAQLSQNMNFVMDATAGEFVALHAESRMVDAPGLVERIIAQANELAGEPFGADTPVTSLSGGQSRALMIADTAFLSRSPIVLIDEIENAGIDRKKALSLLVRNEKIVLIATHDPVLALMCHRRLVLRNGGVACIRETTPWERQNLAGLEDLDRLVQDLRRRIRAGEAIEDPVVLPVAGQPRDSDAGTGIRPEREDSGQTHQGCCGRHHHGEGHAHGGEGHACRCRKAVPAMALPGAARE